MFVLWGVWPRPPEPRAAARAAAARVTEPLALVEIELLAVVLRLAAGRGAGHPREVQRDMGVTDQRDRLGLHVEAQFGLQWRQHVLPDRIARARVVQGDSLIEVLGLKR